MSRRSASSSPFRPTRREVLTLGVGAFVLASAPLVLRGRRRLVRRRVPVMGTLADLALVTDDHRRAHAALDEAVAVLRRTDRTMSRHRRDSDLAKVGAAAGRRGVAVEAETAHVLERAQDFALATDGLFDPCLGTPMRLWNLASRRTPVAEATTRLHAGRAGWRTLEVERRAGAARAYLGDPETGLDLGGIAKGHGVDLAARALRQRGFSDGLVNVGGDLVAWGASPDGDSWRVGVRDPDDPARVAETLVVADAAIATSGDYEHGFWHAGRRYHHLLDPRTARPGTLGARSVTVRAPTCLEADAAATAAFLQGCSGPAAPLGRAAPGAVVVTRLRAS